MPSRPKYPTRRRPPRPCQKTSCFNRVKPWRPKSPSTTSSRNLANRPSSDSKSVAGERDGLPETDVAWESDYHESFTIVTATRIPVLEDSAEARLGQLRPRRATAPTSPTRLPASLRPHPNESSTRPSSGPELAKIPNPLFPNGATPVEARIESSTGDQIRAKRMRDGALRPAVDVAPGTANVDSPAAADVVTSIALRYTGRRQRQSQSHLRKPK